MKLFKKFIAGASLLLLTSSVFGATFSTNILTVGTYTLLTNRANVYGIELVSGTAGSVVFYDQNTLAAPYYGTNWVNAAYTTRVTYPTNYVTSSTGITAVVTWATNVGLWTADSTVAAGTNVLNQAAALVHGAGTYHVYSTDLLFNRGITVVASTNVSIVINYKTP